MENAHTQAAIKIYPTSFDLGLTKSLWAKIGNFIQSLIKENNPKENLYNYLNFFKQKCDSNPTIGIFFNNPETYSQVKIQPTCLMVSKFLVGTKSNIQVQAVI